MTFSRGHLGPQSWSRRILIGLLLITLVCPPPSAFAGTSNGADAGTQTDADTPCEPCLNEQGEPVCPVETDKPPTGETEGPIFLRRGSAIESATDFYLPGPSFGWGQRRTYDSLLVAASGSGEYTTAGIGNGWHGGGLGPYLRKTVGTDVNPTIEFYASASTKLIFTHSSGNNWNVPSGFRGSLVRASAGGPSEIYRLTFDDTGVVLEFHGLHWQVSDFKRGKLHKQKHRDDATHDIEYSYNSSGNGDGLLATVTTAQGWEVVYDYDSPGQLSLVEVKNGDSPTPKVIAKIEYTYFDDDSTSFSSDIGSSGDLVQVMVSRRASNGSSWITRTTQYRYYGLNDPGGPIHQLKSVYEADALERILDDGITDQADAGSDVTANDVLYLDDSDTTSGSNAVSLFASREFTYYKESLATDNTGIIKCVTPFSTGSGEDLNTAYGGAELAEYEGGVGGMVKTETINSACASCGTSTTGGIKHSYFYMNLNGGSSNDPKDVVRIVVEDTEDADGTAIHRRLWGINDDGRVLRLALTAGPTVTGTGLTTWARSWIVNSDTRVVEVRLPSAHAGEVASTGALGDFEKFLNPTGGNPSGQYDTDTVSSNSGVVYYYEYETTEDSTTIGNGEYRTGTRIGKGAVGASSAHYISATNWGDGTADPVWLPVAQYYYPAQGKTSRKDPSRIKSADFDYTYHSGTESPATKITTFAVIDDSTGDDQNGSGEATDIVEHFDTYGRLRWIKDGDEYVHYVAYHPNTGRPAYVMTDVNNPASPGSDVTSGSTGEWEAWTAGGANSNKPARGAGLPTGLEIVHTKYYDDQGRLTKAVDPTTTANSTGATHYVLYEDTTDGDRVVILPYWDSSATESLDAIRVIESNGGGVVQDVYELGGDTTVTDTSGVPTSLPATPSRDDYSAWSHYTYDKINGQLQYSDRYHQIPSSDYGTISNDYYRTVHQYDARGRLEHAIRQVSGGPTSSGVEQVTGFTYDVLDRVTQVKQAVSDATSSIGSDYGTLPTLSLLSEIEYDDDGVGDGYVTKTKQYYDSGKYVGRNYHRTFRGHLRAIEPIYNSSGSGGDSTDKGPEYVCDIDWLGRCVAQATYSEGSVSSWPIDYTTDYVHSSDAPKTSNSGHYNTTINKFDDLGRVYRRLVYPGTQSSNRFEINNYFDRRGNLVASGDEHSAHREFAYDGAGRFYQQRIVKELSSTLYTTSGEFQYQEPEPDPVFSSMSGGGSGGLIELVHAELDDAGNVDARHRVELDDDDPDGFSLSSGTPTDGIRSTTMRWFDKADRVTTSAYYGCGSHNDSATVDRWIAAAVPNPGSTAPTASNANVLVTKYAYDSAGRRYQITDPSGQITHATYDELARVVKIEEDDTGTEERHTLRQYNGLSRVTKLIVDIDQDNTLTNGEWTDANTETGQVTEYQFADGVFADLPTLIKYPDGSTSGTDNVTYTYDLDRQPATREDERQVEITFTYDDIRRPIRQGATSVPAGVDGHVKGIKRQYDEYGRVDKITSTEKADGTGDVRNEIAYEFNTYGLVATSWQDHSDAATTTGGSQSPNVQYAYDTSISSDVFDNGLRMEKVTYPDGDVKFYDYSDSIDDLLRRVTGIWENSAPSGTQLTSYDYNGAARLVATEYEELNIFSHGDANGDNEYGVWDRFGRRVSVAWKPDNGSWTNLKEWINYTYDDAGNRTARNNRLASGSNDDYDQDYEYDDLHRLIDVDQGAANNTSHQVTTKKAEQQWSLDQLGNWEEFRDDVDGTGFAGNDDLEQDRLHNDVNEIDDTNSHSDYPGSAITAPAGQEQWTVPNYDAAGNMTSFPRPNDLDAGYATTYDAWNRLVEVKEGATPIQTNRYDGLHRRILRDESTDTHFYYNTRWQCVEERTTETGAAQKQYVWHPNYIDALAVSYNSSGTKRYYGYDANFNVTTVMNGSGTVVERYHYSAYGDVTVLNDNFSVKTTGFENNEFRYTGRRLDDTTGLHQFRYRYYHAQLGRFVNRDPIGYLGGMNLYGYVGGDPTGYVDPWGLARRPELPNTDWHHLLPQQFRPYFQHAGLIIDNAEFGWIIQTDDHALLHPAWNDRWKDFFKPFDTSNPPSREAILKQLDTMMKDYDHILRRGKLADMTYKEWGDWRAQMRKAADNAKKTKSCTKLTVVRRVGGAMKVVGVITFAYVAANDGVVAAAEDSTRDAMWPFLDMANDAAEYATQPLSDAVDDAEQRLENLEQNPNDPLSYRPGGAAHHIDIFDPGVTPPENPGPLTKPTGYKTTPINRPPHARPYRRIR